MVKKIKAKGHKVTTTAVENLLPFLISHAKCKTFEKQKEIQRQMNTFGRLKKEDENVCYLLSVLIKNISSKIPDQI